MSLGGGPPMLSLLTGVAQGISQGQEIARERQREAILNAMREQSMQATAQMMRQRTEDNLRAAEIHELKKKGMELGNDALVRQGAAAEAAEATRRQQRQSLVSRIMEDRDLPIHEASAMADELLRTNQPYITRAEEQLALRRSEATIAGQQANVAAIQNNIEQSNRRVENEDALMGYQYNPVMAGLGRLEPNQFRAIMQNYDPVQFEQEFGIPMEAAQRTWAQARSQYLNDPAQQGGRAYQMVAQYTRGGAIPASQALAQLRQQVNSGEIDIDGMPEQDKVAFLEAIKMLDAEARRENSGRDGPGQRWAPGTEPPALPEN